MTLSRRNRAIGVEVRLYHLPDEDPSCRWQTDCEHGSCVGHATRKLGESFLAVPWEWCEECRALHEARSLSVQGSAPAPDPCSMSSNDTLDTSTVHPFERRGLGKAPFYYIGVSEKIGPIVISNRDGVTTTIGAPGQPMGTCAYCLIGIAECHHVRSSDGKKFTVGCDCIRRVYGDERAPLRSAAEAASRKLRNAAARKRRAVKATDAREQLEALLADEANCAKLAALPGPQFGTLLEHAQWMLQNARGTGHMAALKRCKAALV